MRALAALLLALAFAPAARAQVVDGVAVIVGDEVVLLSEVRETWQQYVSRVRARGEQMSQEDMLELRRTAVQTLVDEKLVMQVAKKQNLAASDEEIDEAIASIARDEKVSTDQIYAAADAQGLDKKSYREQLGRQITRMKIVQGAVQGKVRVTEDDVKKLYDERYGHAKPGVRVRVLHILIPVPPDSPPAKRAEAREATEQLRAKALANGDFAGLARKYSSAPTASQGGLTVFREVDAPADIKGAIAGLAPGEISPVVENAHGENLFQLLDRFDPSEVPFEQVADRLRGELMEQQTMPAFEKWIADVRKSRYIEVVAPELR